MSKFFKYIHPLYNWNNKVFKEIGKEVYLLPNGDIKHKEDILLHTKDDEDKAKPGHIYGIFEDDGSFEFEFRKSLYKCIEEHENTICSSKIKIAHLKEIGGIE